MDDDWREQSQWSMEQVSVACLLCGTVANQPDLYWGCRACGARGPLAMSYPSPPARKRPVAAAVAETRQRYRPLARETTAPPWRPATPLDAAASLGAKVYLKNEAFSLTGSHKDRANAVNAQVARRVGARGLVASSTGNHGVSVAAHAAAVGLPSVVFCHAEAPAGLLRAINAFGGVAAQLAPAAQRETLVALVEDGWFPATSMDPILSGAANPFGAEGYKQIAYETVEQLGRMPDAVFVPTAGGDTYYGVAKGYAEVCALAAAAMPVVFAVQPVGANPLCQSLAAGRQVIVDQPASIALSIADPQTGRQAVTAIARWRGQALDVTEEAIRTAITDFAALGIYTDPASAAALAGYRLAIGVGAIPPDATAVLLLTSSGFKWPDAMAAVFPAAAVHDVAELRHRLTARFGAAQPALTSRA